jgi:hypothetical protein
VRSPGRWRTKTEGREKRTSAPSIGRRRKQRAGQAIGSDRVGTAQSTSIDSAEERRTDEVSDCALTDAAEG